MFLVDERHTAMIELPLGAFFLDAIDLQNELVRQQYGLPLPANIAGANGASGRHDF